MDCYGQSSPSPRAHSVFSYLAGTDLLNPATDQGQQGQQPIHRKGEGRGGREGYHRAVVATNTVLPWRRCWSSRAEKPRVVCRLLPGLIHRFKSEPKRGSIFLSPVHHDYSFDRSCNRPYWSFGCQTAHCVHAAPLSHSSPLF